MASAHGARVLALEPNTTLTVEHNHSHITLVHAALSHEDGVGFFYLDQNPEGSSIIHDSSKEIEQHKTVSAKFRSLASLVEEFGVDKFALLKLDIEGAEFDVIRSIGDDLAGMIQQITVEFHPASPQGDDVVRMEAAFTHLAAQGFHMCRSSYRGYGDVLFLNSRYFKKPSKGFRLLLPYFRKGLERGLFS